LLQVEFLDPLLLIGLLWAEAVAEVQALVTLEQEAEAQVEFVHL
jgi:hypothetical protein